MISSLPTSDTSVPDDGLYSYLRLTKTQKRDRQMCFVLKPYTPQTFVIALRTSSLNLEHEMPYTTVKVSFGDSHLGPESRYGPSVF